MPNKTAETSPEKQTSPRIPSPALFPQRDPSKPVSSHELDIIAPTKSRSQPGRNRRGEGSRQHDDFGGQTQEDDEPQATEWATDQTQPHEKANWQLVSACLMNFGNGMNDSAPGALIPYLEKDYNIGYAIVSLIFIANAVGFILAAPLTHTIKAKIGQYKSYALSMGLVTVSYIAIVCHPPFAVVVAAFLLLGFGMAMSIAMNNVFCANLHNSTTALGCFSGAYGIGGVISPLFATLMVSHDIRWTYFYTITLAISVANLLLSSFAFRNYEDNSTMVSQRAPDSVIMARNNGNPPSRMQMLKKAIQDRTTILGSLFIFAYQGAEVSVSGWIVSFLISYRGGDSRRVGYVSAGFWAGITLGRFLIVYPAHRIGEKIVVGLLVVGAIGFQLMTWLIPNIIGEAVAVAILGLLLGPLYPCSTAVFAKLLPRSMQLVSLGFISALGSSGGAVFPFLTGILAQNMGTMVLHPICLVLYAVMIISWCTLPAISKRSE
ncbi:MFS general substrate transporter [Aspergillus transmontanensis]|uniref:MFS general substrate transporter n=1 Tax=Aspergillus transmontanensis TaxID=1034304 RepID=A0A5N6WBY6_9EURO|nr:MFS general substrate transporter [Aspergillus transmontanensis]